MDYKDFIEAELIVLVPVIYLIGAGLKKSKVSDKRIPLILGVLSIALCGLWVFATNNIANTKQAALALFTSITQGVLVAGADVYINQLYKQTKKEE